MDELNLDGVVLAVDCVLRGRLNFETEGLESLQLSFFVSVLKDSGRELDVETVLGHLRSNISFVRSELCCTERSLFSVLSFASDDINRGLSLTSGTKTFPIVTSIVEIISS